MISLIYILYLLIMSYSVVSLNLEKTLLKPFKRKSSVLGDLNKCRVTHSGVEYEGNVAQTKSGILCQNWETPDPIHKVSEEITDADFPEGSKKKAKNYCRNPRHWTGKPWCYTLDFNIIEEECDIPLCVKEDCRSTGPGVEYSGNTHSSGSKECLPWSEIRGTEYKEILYNSLYPEGSSKMAENKCRNPDSDAGGPWCFVDGDNKGQSSSNYEKMYCGIPLCDPKPCMVATTAVATGYKDYHTVFSLLPPNTTSINFSIKLWHPDHWQSGELKLALAVYPIPTTGRHMRLWKTGIEVIISNYKSGLTPKDDDESDWNVELGLLKGTQWRDLVLSWTGGFISLKASGKPMAIFTKDYTGNEKELSNVNFQFYSIKGSNALWNFPFCSDDYAFEEHVTEHGDFERRWPLPKTNAGYELKFFVRGFHTAIIELKPAAMLQYPSVQLTLINSKKDNLTTLTLKESFEGQRVTLSEQNLTTLISYWEWREFSLTVDGPRLELYSIRDTRLIKLLSDINHRFEFIKWFSIGSRQSTVHWAFNSSPPKDKLKIPAELPECVMSEIEVDFVGKQSVTETGLTCVPWADLTGMIPQSLEDSNFVDGSKKDARNYCRNPTGSYEGPFCYAADLTDTEFVVNKENCAPRQCRSHECRMSGTGNDYIGSLSVTISNRTCQRWTAKTPHEIPQQLLNKAMFPELSTSNVSNFCRNPSHDPAGPWCYTTDPALDTDTCKVPDCDVFDSCTVIIKGNLTRQKFYILPLWKTNGFVFKVKSWDPKNNEGIKLLIELAENNTLYRLELGAGNNDKVILYYVNSESIETVLKQKTVARIIPSGHWVGFQLILGFGEIGLKYENVPSVFFQWKYTFTEGMNPLHPKFLSYSTINNSYSIGLNLPCGECHTHITQPGIIENVYPINWWKPEQNHSKLSINIRGSGTFVLVLMRVVLDLTSRILIEVSDYGRVVVKDYRSVISDSQNDKLFNDHSWKNLLVILTEHNLTISTENTTVVNFSSPKPLVFYYFSISVSDGLLIWSSNCDPPNIDAPPLNGGWSEWGIWDCSVTCGGGHGKRKRICNHPTPNLFGEPCNGSDFMEGVCNDFKCGDVPPDLYKMMAEHTIKQAHNVRKKVGEPFQVFCDQFILKELKDVSPKTKVEWTKDGLLLQQQKVSNVTEESFKIKKETSNMNDSGVYICSLEDRKGKRAVIKLTAVIIITNSSTLFSRKGSTIFLDCQATALTYIFPDLTQFWTLNGKLFHDFGAASTSLVDIDLLSPVTTAHEGEWECIVADVQHNLTWATTWFKLKVRESSALAIMFDKMFLGLYFRPFGSNIVLNSISALLLVIIVVLLISTICFLFKRHKDKVPETRRSSIFSSNLNKHYLKLHSSR